MLTLSCPADGCNACQGDHTGVTSVRVAAHRLVGEAERVQV